MYLPNINNSTRLKQSIVTLHLVSNTTRRNGTT
jgi:hypothetical protein